MKETDKQTKNIQQAELPIEERVIQEFWRPDEEQITAQRIKKLKNSERGSGRWSSFILGIGLGVAFSSISPYNSELKAAILTPMFISGMFLWHSSSSARSEAQVLTMVLTAKLLNGTSFPQVKS